MYASGGMTNVCSTLPKISAPGAESVRRQTTVRVLVRVLARVPDGVLDRVPARAPVRVPVPENAAIAPEDLKNSQNRPARPSARAAARPKAAKLAIATEAKASDRYRGPRKRRRPY